MSLELEPVKMATWRYSLYEPTEVSRLSLASLDGTVTSTCKSLIHRIEVISRYSDIEGHISLVIEWTDRYGTYTSIINVSESLPKSKKRLFVKFTDWGRIEIYNGFIDFRVFVWVVTEDDPIELERMGSGPNGY